MPQAASWSGMPSVKGASETMRMALLSFSLIGIQFTWGIEMTYGTPYLLSLGLSKSRTSAVWIAGPLSGLIVQPIVGVIADNSTSRWGRRRPFMVFGSFVVAACLLVLGWTAEIVEMFVSNPDSRAWWNVAVAVGSIYATDFSINVVQSCCRSLIVDTLPIPKQQLGTAWASRMAAIGHLIGYGIGTLNLRGLWGGWLGDSQFKQLCVIAGLALILACAVTSYAVTERVLIRAQDADTASGAIATVVKLFRMILHLPPRIQAICWVQFWAWIGWFPFLFYSPTWVGETYFRSSNAATPSTPTPPLSPSDRLGEIGRIGSLCLVIFSAITFVASVVFPFLIKSPASPSIRKFTPRPLPALAPLLKALERFHRQRPDLLTAWTISNVVFGCLMLLAPLVQSVAAAAWLVSLAGLPWAVQCWAPFNFMGVEVNRLSAPGGAGAGGHGRSVSLVSLNSNGPFPPGQSADGGAETPGSPTTLRLDHGGWGAAGRASRNGSTDVNSWRGGGGGGGGGTGLLDPDDDFDLTEADAFLGVGGLDKDAPVSSTGETAGIYLGVLNVFTTLPQFVGTFISMIVFAVLEPAVGGELGGGAAAAAAAAAAGDGGPEGALAEGMAEPVKEGVNAIAMCLFIGGICAFGSAYAATRLRYVR